MSILVVMAMQDVVDHVMQHLEHEVGMVRVMRMCEPQEVRRESEGGALTVSWHDSTTNQNYQVCKPSLLFASIIFHIRFIH